MSELPAQFKYWEEHYETLPEFANLLPFAFDADKNTFTAADRQIAAAELYPYRFNSFELEIDNKGIRNIDELAQHPLFVNYEGRLIASPALHVYAGDHQQEIATELPFIMHEVFISLYEDPAKIPFLKDEGGHRGFRAGANQDNGGISLQVFGECACLNPSQTGYFTQLEGIEKGFAEYELHNADLQAQQTSLYAGLGHIAKLASEA